MCLSLDLSVVASFISAPSPSRHLDVNTPDAQTHSEGAFQAVRRSRNPNGEVTVAIGALACAADEPLHLVRCAALVDLEARKYEVPHGWPVRKIHHEDTLCRGNKGHARLEVGTGSKKHTQKIGKEAVLGPV